MKKTYKEYISELKRKWIGKTVFYQNKQYKVIDVDYNGCLLINKPHYYCASYTADTTAILISHLDK